MSTSETVVVVVAGHICLDIIPTIPERAGSLKIRRRSQTWPFPAPCRIAWWHAWTGWER